MKADIVLATFREFLRGNRDEALHLMRQCEASESAAGRVAIATRLRSLLSTTDGWMRLIKLPSAPAGLQCVEPQRKLDSLVLAEFVVAELDRLIAEWRGREALMSHGLTPRRTLLLYGPSGNGKTALAESLATELRLPFCIARHEEIIDSHMGETGKEIAKVMDFAATTPCVAFFDECDSLIATRSDGGSAAGKESNRIVNQMLMKLDGTSPASLIVFATNRATELDAAFTRRIGLKLELDRPWLPDKQRMIERLVIRWPFIAGKPWIEMAQNADSFAAIEALAETEARATVLAMAV